MISINKKLIANFVFVLLVFNNIWSIFYSKDIWAGYDAAIQSGWQYQLSKIIYGVIILLMIPVVIKYRRYFDNLVIMAAFIMLHVIYAYVLGAKMEIGEVSKFFMICLAFPFFSIVLRSPFDRTLLKVLIIVFTFNIIFSILRANTLTTSMKADFYGTGQATAINIIYLLPVVFYVFKDKIASYFYLLGFLLVIMSLRRTAIIAYLICLPFIYSRIKSNISFKTLLAIVVIMCVLAFYVVTNYWQAIEIRFVDMFEADSNGNYGSGRSDWYALLFNTYLKNPLYWLQGAGPQQVGILLDKAGYLFHNAHSDILELLIGYGMIGLLLWLYTFCQIFILSRKRTTSENRKLIYMSISSYLFISAFSGSIFNPNFIILPISYGLFLNKKKI